MKKTKNIKLIIILTIVLILAGYGTYICLHYFFYKGYEKYLTHYTYETGTEFTGLSDGDPQVPGMVLGAENDNLKLYTNLKTTEIAVYDKRTGEITYSNPVDRKDDPIASGRNMTALNSQFMISYYDLSMTQVTMYNYEYSVEREQFEIEALEDGIRYTYLLGNLDSPTGLVPPYILEERLQEKILDQLSEREARTFRNSYLPSKDLEGFMELTSGAKASKVGLQKMNKMLDGIGYSQTDFDEDARLAAGGELVERTTFNVVLEYRLRDDKLVVNVPTEAITSTGTGKIYDISLLNFFGAGSLEEEGYILVPNGSGSLIYFNNGKQTERYNQYIYGMDETLQSFTVVEDTHEARMPIFGIKKENSAIFAEITNGDSLANIIAEVSGKVNSYNYVFPSFNLRGSEKVSMFGAEGVSADLPTAEKEIYKLDISIEYSFLTKENASYSGMANYYRDELISRGVLEAKKDRGNVPFYLDIVGGVKRQQSILGVPYLTVYPMTTFEEAGVIVDALSDKGIDNIKMNYLGWFNGGYYHDVAKDIKIDRKMGGKKDWNKLYEKLTANGSKLFGDVSIQRISFESDHYNYRMENARYYSGFVVSFGRVNPVTMRQTGGMGYMETNFNVLSPKFLDRHVRQFLNEIKRINISGVTFRDMGELLTSDKRRTNVINRQESKQIVMGQLELMEEAIGDMMFDGGNSYSWGYASDLINIPGGHNPYYIVDEEVPFYQMVINGYIDYASSSINLSDSYHKQEIILRMIEYGSAPHFTFSYADSSEIKYTGLNSLYSTQYETWLDEALEIYQATNKALSHVMGSTMIDHNIIDDGIKKITYDNGVTIYVNVTKNSFHVGDITIPPMDYLVEGVANE